MLQPYRLLPLRYLEEVFLEHRFRADGKFQTVVLVTERRDALFELGVQIFQIFIRHAGHFRDQTEVGGAINDPGFCDFDTLPVGSSARSNKSVTIPFDKDVGHNLASSIPLESGTAEAINPENGIVVPRRMRNKYRLLRIRHPGEDFPDFPMNRA